jgi:serine/threonine protein kinase
MAPEVLNEAMDVDYMLADVYAFGIIMWELLTRQQPYNGMTYVDHC